MSKETNKVHIPIIISDVVLQENPSVAEQYDKETQNIFYEIEPTIPEEFVTQLKQLVPSFHGSDIVVFNPLISAVNELQKIKELQYNPEDVDGSERVYIDNNKIVGSFNSALKEAKSIMKEPHISMNKKIDAIFNLFENESKNTRGALESNFSELLKKRQEEKDAKEAKKKEAEIAKIAELSGTNTNLENQLAQQKKENAELQIKSSLDSIVANVAIKIPTLNLEGLTTLDKNLMDIQFNMYVAPEIQNLFTPEEIGAYQTLFKENKRVALQNIEIARSNINATAQNVANQTQAQPEPIAQPEQNNQEVLGTATPLDFLNGTDAQIFANITKQNENIVAAYQEMIQNARTANFKNPEVAELRDKLVNEQFPKMLDWLQKLSQYCQTKQSVINQHFNN